MALIKERGLEQHGKFIVRWYTAHGPLLPLGERQRLGGCIGVRGNHLAQRVLFEKGRGIGPWGKELLKARKSKRRLCSIWFREFRYPIHKSSPFVNGHYFLSFFLFVSKRIGMSVMFILFLFLTVQFYSKCDHVGPIFLVGYFSPCLFLRTKKTFFIEKKK